MASPADGACEPEGRRLNNFVRELIDAPLKDGTYMFTLSAAGWVYIGLDARHFGTEVLIDGAGRPALAYRGDESPETMLHLDAGAHRVEVVGAPKGGGRLSVRSVKTYRLVAPASVPLLTDLSAPPPQGYGVEFRRRWLKPAFNVITNCAAADLRLANLDEALVSIAPDAPLADVKKAYDRYFQRLVVEDAGCGIDGISVPSLARDEETVRWIARLVRHYGVKGRTDSLAESSGLSAAADDGEQATLLALSTRYDAAKEARILAAIRGKACERERVRTSWSGPREILATHPDRVAFVPEQPQWHADRSPKRRGDSYNDHFQVIDDPRRGFLYAFWTQATKEAAPDQHIAFSKSSDGGFTWTPPAILAGSETQTYPRLVASWQQPMLARSGRLYCLWNQQVTSRGPHVGVIFGSFSDDAGDTWSPPKLVKFPRRNELADPNPAVPPSWCNWQRPLRLGKGGRFLVGCSYHGRLRGVPGTRTRVEFWRYENIDDDPKVEDIRISCFPSGVAMFDADQVDSGGARLYVPRPGSTPDVAVEEAAIVKLPDGRLFALCRSSVGYPVWSVSADGGETWSRLRILRDHDGGTPFLHPRSPCPIYDWKGPEAASGRYFALVHDAFDFHGERAYQPRGTLYLISGRFDPKADQPIAFERRGIFSPRCAGNSCYSSYVNVGGRGMLWYNDRKFFLLGREIAESMLGE